jgi:hypothetical protein
MYEVVRTFWPAGEKSRVVLNLRIASEPALETHRRCTPQVMIAAD